MKKLLLLFVLIGSIQAIAQEIPKKAYKIIIKNTLTADENFNLVGRTLADNDFTIESKDKEFGMIKTGIKPNGRFSQTFFYTFAIKQNEIAISGQWSVNASMNFGGATAENSFWKIEYTNGEFKRVFNSMNTFALKLGSDLKYITE